MQSSIPRTAAFHLNKTNKSHAATVFLMSFLFHRHPPLLRKPQWTRWAYRLCLCPSAGRSSLSSSQASTRPRASSSRRTPSYRWPAKGTQGRTDDQRVIRGFYSEQKAPTINSIRPTPTRRSDVASGCGFNACWLDERDWGVMRDSHVALHLHRRSLETLFYRERCDLTEQTA